MQNKNRDESYHLPNSHTDSLALRPFSVSLLWLLCFIVRPSGLLSRLTLSISFPSSLIFSSFPCTIYLASSLVPFPPSWPFIFSFPLVFPSIPSRTCFSILVLSIIEPVLYLIKPVSFSPSFPSIDNNSYCYFIFPFLLLFSFFLFFSLLPLFFSLFSLCLSFFFFIFPSSRFYFDFSPGGGESLPLPRWLRYWLHKIIKSVELRMVLFWCAIAAGVITCHI